MSGRNCPSSRISCDGAGPHEPHFLARRERPLHDPHVSHHAAVRVVLAVEDQGPQRSGRTPLGRRHLLDDLPKDVVDADPLLGADLQGLGRVEADDRLDLLEDFVDAA